MVVSRQFSVVSGIVLGYQLSVHKGFRMAIR